MPALNEGIKTLLVVLAAPGLYCLLVLAGRRLKRKRGVRLGWLYHLFALSLAVYVPALLVGAEWDFLHHLGAAVVVLGAIVVLAFIDRYLWDLYFRVQHGVTVPKFLTELVRIIVLTVAVFLVLDLAYGQSLTGLLVAPGIAAVVIGLAMQDLVGNIIAGVALQSGKSFAQGDWLMIENRPAEVIEINWRSTRLQTLDEIQIEIPNREIARQTIINLNRPQRLHAHRLSFTLDSAEPPTRVKEVLLHAVANAQGVAPEPKPKVYLKDFADSGIQYEIKFWLDNYARFSEVCDAVRSHVWYSLHRHGIRIPFPTRTLLLERAEPDKRHEIQSTARLMLCQHALFRCLTDEQLDTLLPRGRAVHFGRGEKLIRQGEEGDSMFILVEGKAEVTVERKGAPHPVATLTSGDCFGEMSLLTGERRTATVTAYTDCEVVEIGKLVLGKSLKEHPRLLQQLSELLAKRQVETEGILNAESHKETAQTKQSTYAAGFKEKLRKFFEL